METMPGLAVGLPTLSAAGRRPAATRHWFARARARAAISAPAPAGRVASVACAGLVAAEVIGSAFMWVPIPIAWMWVGAAVYNLTGSVAADGAVVLAGFIASTTFATMGLSRLDTLWIALRRRAGHDQKEGALTRVVVASATLGILMFLIWFYVLSDAFVLPFMPTV
jgi:hypothetical protein